MTSPPVRQRLELLVDRGSLLAVDATTRGVIGGLARIGGRLVTVLSEDPDEPAPAPGWQRAEKVCRLLDLAADHRAPLLATYGPPAADRQGDGGLAACPQVAVCAARLSGVVPQITTLLGACRGAAALAAAVADFALCVDGPGAPAEGFAREGHCDFGVDSPALALLVTRELLGYLPSSAVEPPPPGDSADDPLRLVEEIEELVPLEAVKAYDVKRLIECVVDDGRFLELKPTYARNLVIGFARFHNRVGGIVANQPSHLAGVIDLDAACKAARFMRFCDAFNIPLVTFVDVPGFLPGTEQELSGMIRHGAKLGYACCESTVPKISVIVRKAYGGAFAVMGSNHMGGDINLAYPFSEIAVMGPEAAVGLLYREELRRAGDRAEEVRAELIAEFRASFANPYMAAELGHLDGVITPRETRRAIVRAMHQLEHKRPSTPRRKHGNIPL